MAKIVVLLVALLMPNAALAESRFDGKWHGESCASGATLEFIVAGDTVNGQYSSGIDHSRINGKIAADGSFDGGWLTGKFNGKSFIGTFTRATKGTACRVTADLQ